MVYNARARHAQISLSGVLPAFLETSRAYLGLPRSTHRRQLIIVASEFVDPIRYRVHARVSQGRVLA